MMSTIFPLAREEPTGLSAGTVITKETKEPNNRVLLGALLFGCIVSFVLRNRAHETTQASFCMSFCVKLVCT